MSVFYSGLTNPHEICEEIIECGHCFLSQIRCQDCPLNEPEYRCRDFEDTEDRSVDAMQVEQATRWLEDHPKAAKVEKPLKGRRESWLTRLLLKSKR